MEKQDYKMIKVYKKIAGSLSIELQDYQNMTQSYIVTIPADQDFKPVPLGYVISMFFLPHTLRSFNNGSWSLDAKDKEEVVTRATELGLYFKDEYGPDTLDQPEIMFSDREIRSFLERNRLNEIESIIKQGSPQQKELLANVASELADVLNRRTIRTIEEGLQISIEESDM